MRSFLLTSVICLGSLLAAGQTSSPQTPSTTPKAPGQKPAAKAPPAKPQGRSKEVVPDTPVITIKGLCPTPAPKAASSKTASESAAGKPCETVVTQKQLELLIDTFKPNLPPAQRKMLAQQYVELLVIADAAGKAGVEKDPKVQEQIRIQKLQILATAYTREMQQKEAEVSPADIEKYYKENSAKYEQAKLLRIYVPMVTEEGKPPDAAASKGLAEKIQQRAAAGEDFDKLQKEAFSAANNKGTPPSTDMGERRRGTLPPKQESAVFGLKAGEVSPALEEPSGFYIYKVVSKDEVPLDKVHEEIKGTLARERFRESMEKLRSSVKPEFNDAYFEVAAPPEPLAAPSPQTPAPSATPPQPPAPAGEAPKTPPPGPPQSK